MAIEKATTPAIQESLERRQLGSAINELLHQAYDAFGLPGKGSTTRILEDPDGQKEDEVEHLTLRRNALGGSFEVMQRQYGTDRSIHLAYRKSPDGRIVIADATYSDSGEALSGEAALFPIVEAFGDGTILPGPIPPSSV